VVFAGPVHDDHLPALYALADVFAMVSREQAGGCDVEGFGLVFLEAAACGKPTVGGRSGGIPDAVCEGHTGLLVDPLSTDDTAGALARLLTDPGLASEQGNNGRDWVAREHRWSDVGDAVHRIMQEAAQEKTKRSVPSTPLSGRSSSHRGSRYKRI
jgi:phosphatidylinositol alpha-1,6-mannosyltransferase